MKKNDDSILQRPVTKAVIDFLAGSVAGMTSISVVYPLDTIRTRLQTTSASQFSGPFDAFLKTIRNEGFFALYKGMSSPLAAQMLQKAIMFGANGMARRFLQGDVQDVPLTIPQLFICGSFAGFANTIVATPIELIRNRLMTQYQPLSKSIKGASHAKAQYSGPLDCARQVIKANGVGGLWRGMGSTLLRDIPGVGAWFATFQFFKRYFDSALPEQYTKWGSGLPVLVVSGGLGGIGYWVTAFPQDAIKSIIQTDTKGKYRGTFDCARQLIKEGGVLRLYRGFLLGAGRGIPGAATTFTTYALIMRWIYGED